MSAGHHHGHDHSHSHGAQPLGRAFAIATGLNVAFVIAELLAGWWSNSLALIGDATHNAVDVLGLIMAWVAHWLASRSPDMRRTYGLQRGTILAALGSAILLMAATGSLAWEAVERLQTGATPHALTIIVVAGIGVIINGLSAALLVAGAKGDLNVRAAMLHLLADTAVSVGVVLGGLVFWYTAWTWLDPVLTLFIAAVILISGWGIFRESFAMAMDNVPAHIKPEHVEAYLKNHDNVLGVHDLHIWPLSTTKTALTAHLVVSPNLHQQDDLIRQLADHLHHQFDIGHTTLQIEHGDFGDCATPHGQACNLPEQHQARRGG